MSAITPVLTALGALFASYQVYQLVLFIWIYFLRPSSLPRYIHGSTPYALVTGASDGIGKETAKELYRKGFNLILHGRNEGKVKMVVEEIRAMGSRDVQYFIAASDSADVDFSEIASRLKDLNITLVVNNVGGGRDRPDRLDSLMHSDEDLMGDIRLNALFPFFLTRALLPQLRASKGPALVAFVGSMSAEMHIPRLYSYAPCKAFLWQLTRCLNADERWWTPSKVSFIYLRVGAVNSNSFRASPTFFTPTSEKFGKSVVAALGSDQEAIIPYFGHAILKFGTKLASERTIEAYGAQTMKAEVFDRRSQKVD